MGRVGRRNEEEPEKGGTVASGPNRAAPAADGHTGAPLPTTVARLQQTLGNRVTRQLLQRRSYAAIDPQMRGNNAVRVLEQDGFHISVVDPVRGTPPRRSLDFKEFHVTVENGTEAERQAHFFYEEDGSYNEAKTLGHAQTQRYIADVEAAGITADGRATIGDADGATRLRPVGTLANMSSYAARGFLALLTNATQAAAGVNALRVRSTLKPVNAAGLTAAQRMSAKPPSYSLDEGRAFAAAVGSRLGAAATVHGPFPFQGGQAIDLMVVPTDWADQADAVRLEAAGLPGVASVTWAKYTPTPPGSASPAPTSPATSGGGAPTGPAPTGPAPTGPAPTGAPQPSGRTAPTGRQPTPSSAPRPRGGRR